MLAVVVAVTAFSLWQPLLAALLAGALGALGLFWRRPEAVLYGLLVLMGSVKINVYAGFFTFFPEYLLVVLGGLAWFARWSERPHALREPGLYVRFLVWIAAGALSFVFAPRIGAVFARVVLMGLVLSITLLTVEAVSSRRVLRRAVVIWEVTAVLFAAYGIVQMIGLVAGFDPSPRFLEKYSNPELYLGVGAPVRLRIGNFFRANSFFNDPNILAGYLAATMSAMLALRTHHALAGRGRRALLESLGFALMGVCLLLTLSRSGIVALAVGVGIVLVQWPRLVAQVRVWVAVGVVVFLAGMVAVLVQIEPLLLVQRLIGSFDTNDLSNRTHVDVFLFGAQLLARFPITGCGLGNFGEFYGLEVDAYFRNMMTHCAPMTYFAESGLAGGVAFLSLVSWVAWQSWTVVRDRELRVRDPELHAIATALFAAIIVIDVANLFYDYYLRTFVWVLSGLAVALPRFAARGGDREAA